MAFPPAFFSPVSSRLAFQISDLEGGVTCRATVFKYNPGEGQGAQKGEPSEPGDRETSPVWYQLTASTPGS